MRAQAARLQLKLVREGGGIEGDERLYTDQGGKAVVEFRTAPDQAGILT